MIRFKMGEIPELIGGFHGKLAKEKRYKPPGRWRPFINVNTVVLQDEDTDKWVAWLEWELMDGKGAYPCRDTAKHESISRTDPPDCGRPKRWRKELPESAATPSSRSTSNGLRAIFQGAVTNCHKQGEQHETQHGRTHIFRTSRLLSAGVPCIDC